MPNAAWPPLPYDDWKDTYATLHLWTQVVGKVALALAPPINHSWGVALQVTARGLSTRPLPHTGRLLTLSFDFIDHLFVVEVSDGRREVRPLRPQTVADFLSGTIGLLDELGLPVKIWPVAVELPAAIRLDTDREHRSYDPEAANRCWRILATVEQVLAETRCGFVGKCSPVHFFWGSFDLAVTRFSGRLAPPREGPAFMREAYSHEVISHGFWPGNDAYPRPLFYAYCVPEPPGLKTAVVQPRDAAYDTALGEFLLPYDAVRTAPDPADALRRFVTSTYEQAATLARWDRAALERRSA